MTLIFLSDIPWHGLHQRPQHVASRLSQRWPLLWVEPATLLKKTHFTPFRIEPNLHILSVPAFPYNARSGLIRILTWLLGGLPLIRWIVLRMELQILRRALRLLKANEVGFFVQNFQLISIVDSFTPKIVSFDYIDNAFGFRRLPKYMHDAWLKTLKRADVVSVTSPTLKKQIESAHPAEIHVVSNGTEYEPFAFTDGRERPHDLPPEGNPIVGYIGAVNTWFDFDLLEHLLSTMKETQFVVIGHEHPDTKRILHSLASFRNFSFLGFRPYIAIPSYLRHFSAGIIPFKRNKLTEAVNPVKLYEYSAAGLPTVSTDFSEDLKEFAHLIFVARSHDEFAARMQEALQKSKDTAFIESLRTFARQNDWNAKAASLIRLIEIHLQSHQ